MYDDPFVLVLGIAQDGGFPQAGCLKACCKQAWRDRSRGQFVACLAIVDPEEGQRWLVDCTPDFADQLYLLEQVAPAETCPGLDGILLTHAHIGHYTGLIHLGRESISAEALAVHAMPRMRDFLQANAPWSQLVEQRQIVLKPLDNGQRQSLNSRVCITPIEVPHRDEYSETVGFRIAGPRHSVIYVPDTDNWGTGIGDLLANCDAALLDGTFFDSDELPDRDISKIAHPFVKESMTQFETLPVGDRDKVHFTHFNHTNPLLDPSSQVTREVESRGYHIAWVGQRFAL